MKECPEGTYGRCIFVMGSDGKEHQICICRPQWPPVVFPYYPKFPGPDPGPLLKIDGITDELMDQITMLDVANMLGGKIGGEAGESIKAAAKIGLKAISKQITKRYQIGITNRCFT